MSSCSSSPKPPPVSFTHVCVVSPPIHSLVHIQQSMFPLRSTFCSPLTTFAGSTQDSSNDINCKFPFDTNATDSHNADDRGCDTKLSTTNKSLGFIKTVMAAASCMTPAASAMTAPSVVQHRQAAIILLAIVTLLRHTCHSLSTTPTTSTSAATQAMPQGSTLASAASVTTGSCTTPEEKTSMVVSKTPQHMTTMPTVAATATSCATLVASVSARTAPLVASMTATAAASHTILVATHSS